MNLDQGIDVEGDFVDVSLHQLLYPVLSQAID